MGVDALDGNQKCPISGRRSVRRAACRVAISPHASVAQWGDIADASSVRRRRERIAVVDAEGRSRARTPRFVTGEVHPVRCITGRARCRRPAAPSSHSSPVKRAPVCPNPAGGPGRPAGGYAEPRRHRGTAETAAVLSSDSFLANALERRVAPAVGRASASGSAEPFRHRGNGGDPANPSVPPSANSSPPKRARLPTDPHDSPCVGGGSAEPCRHGGTLPRAAPTQAVGHGQRTVPRDRFRHLHVRERRRPGGGPVHARPPVPRSRFVTGTTGGAGSRAPAERLRAAAAPTVDLGRPLLPNGWARCVGRPGPADRPTCRWTPDPAAD
jgi:hypothetical protein